MITFKESSLYSLMNETLLDYIQLCDMASFTDGIKPLDIVKGEEIPYLSEWFDKKGFDWLDEIKVYSFKEDKEYNDFVEFQRLVWTLNKDTDNLTHLFVTFTNYMSNVIEFSRTHGMKVQSEIKIAFPRHDATAYVKYFDVLNGMSCVEVSKQDMIPWGEELAEKGLMAV